MFKWIKDVFSKEDENNEEIQQETQETIEEQVVEETLSEIESLELKANYNEPLTEEEVEEVEEVIEELKEEALTENSIEDLEEDKILENVENLINTAEEVEIVKEVQEEVIEEIVAEETVEVTDEVVEEKKKPNIFQRLMDGLSKTRDEVSIKINTMLGAYVKIDDEMFEDLEDILISADIGMETTMKLIDNLRESIIREKVNDPNEVIPMLKEEAKKLMATEQDSKIKSEAPTIILVVGVNGVGKTTTIGKMSSKLKSSGKKVVVAAGDTFRAAAIDQLKEWGNRAEVDIIAHNEGSDPASVIFDGISAAKSRKADVLICDTAGRLHNKANLMKELEKINRIIDREYPEANRETLLVLDSTTGQNAMNQAKTFKEVCDITGIVLTKLDGTAKGGVVIALQSELQVPIKLIGVGEGIDDLQEFDIDSFLNAIFDK